MHVMKRKTRMISVRLTEEEYHALQAFCVSQGARSVSDLTRDAVNVLISEAQAEAHRASHGDTNRSIKAKVTALDIQIRALGETVEKLTAYMANGKGR